MMSHNDNLPKKCICHWKIGQFSSRVFLTCFPFHARWMWVFNSWTKMYNIHKKRLLQLEVWKPKVQMVFYICDWSFGKHNLFQVPVWDRGINNYSSLKKFVFTRFLFWLIIWMKFQELWNLLSKIPSPSRAWHHRILFFGTTGPLRLILKMFHCSSK